jgi:PKHD-type hydroxylase
MKKNNTSSTSWNFEIDRIPAYAYQEDVFSSDECQKIINISENYYLKEAKVKNNKNFKGRQSKICWFFPDENTEWIYRRITDVVVNLNEQYFKFDLQGLVEGLQFTKYIAPDGQYDKHVDRVYNSIIRKLSLTVQLSNPNHYEGGELKFFEDNIGSTVQKKQGTMILFPSFILHQVTPITKGERNSLVAWITGKNFK